LGVTDVLEDKVVLFKDSICDSCEVMYGIGVKLVVAGDSFNDRDDFIGRDIRVHVFNIQ